MSRTTRHSKRQLQKDKRRAKRKEARKNGNGRKAGSIAIHSRLPGIEGTLIGSMDVVVDGKRADKHPALITVVVYQRTERRSVVWTIETGFGGQTPRTGVKVIPDGQLDDLPPNVWFADIESMDLADPADVIELIDVSAESARRRGQAGRLYRTAAAARHRHR